MKFVCQFSFSGVIICICPLQPEYIVTVAGVESRYTYRLKGFYLDRNAKFSNSRGSLKQKVAGVFSNNLALQT